MTCGPAGPWTHFVADPNTVRRIARLAELVPANGWSRSEPAWAPSPWPWPRRGPGLPPWRSTATSFPSCGTRSRRAGSGWWRRSALTLDWAALLEDDGDTGADSAGHDAPWVLVANLPYNVAVPVILRVLEEAPAVASMLVMVQREVGERLAAVPGTKSYGAVSVKVAYYATARLVGRVPAAVSFPGPGWSPFSSASSAARRWPSIRRWWRPSVCSPSCEPASPNGARCCGGRWPGSSIRRCSPPPPSTRKPGPKNCRLRTGGDWWRARTASMTSSTTVTAPAKLTLSLRVTGRRPDGYHLLDAEMVTVSCPIRSSSVPATTSA